MWFIKAFIYLNDVDEAGGPFTYVEGSHKTKFDDWNKRPWAMRYSDKEIVSAYGESAIEKVEILKECGVTISKNPSVMGDTVKSVLEKS